jgi:DNA replication and repair protein RecF
VYLRQLSITQFKNHRAAELDFDRKVICFYGLNGVGKTNLLDAIHYLSTGKGAFSPGDNQHITFGEQFFGIQGTFIWGGEQYQVRCAVANGRKKVLKVNGAEYERLSGHYGRFPVVMVSPQDMALATEGHEERRRFMDSTISLYDPIYLSNLARYNQALGQRNSLLKAAKDDKKIDLDLLMAYEQHLSSTSRYLFPARKAFVDQLLPHFNRLANNITGDRETLEISYDSQLHQAPLTELFDRFRDRELVMGRTEYGLHKDKLQLMIGGMPLTKYGSQGQQKSHVIALKLSQAAVVEVITGKKSMLLLDDLFDRLDPGRVERVLGLSMTMFEQLCVTNTQKSAVERALKGHADSVQYFSVDLGAVSKD